ncbi:MAG: Crp/Fnr family transcriptional regulator [Candidatus Saccharimonadales bacterium]
MHTDLLLDIFDGSREFTFAKGQTIDPFNSTDKLYYIRKGYVKRYLINKFGETAIQGIYGPGYIFPLTGIFISLFNQRVYSGEEEYFFEAMTDITLLRTDTKAFMERAEVNPEVYRAILFETGQRLQSAIHHFENTSFRHAYKKVVHQLVFLAQQFGQAEPRGIKLMLPLTQQDLADTIMISRETVSHVIVRLRDMGLILPTKLIIIPDINKLKAVYS